MNEPQRERIREMIRSNLYTPLEVAEILRLDFSRVSNFIEKEGLGPKQFAVAVNVVKARSKDAYYRPCYPEC